MLHVFSDRLGGGLNVQLFINSPDIGANRVNADIQMIGGLLVRHPLGETIQNHLFTCREGNLFGLSPVGPLK